MAGRTNVCSALLVGQSRVERRLGPGVEERQLNRAGLLGLGHVGDLDGQLELVALAQEAGRVGLDHDFLLGHHLGFDGPASEGLVVGEAEEAPAGQGFGDLEFDGHRAVPIGPQVGDRRRPSRTGSCGPGRRRGRARRGFLAAAEAAMPPTTPPTTPPMAISAAGAGGGAMDGMASAAPSIRAMVFLPRGILEAEQPLYDVIGEADVAKRYGRREGVEPVDVVAQVGSAGCCSPTASWSCRTRKRPMMPGKP